MLSKSLSQLLLFSDLETSLRVVLAFALCCEHTVNDNTNHLARKGKVYSCFYKPSDFSVRDLSHTEFGPQNIIETWGWDLSTITIHSFYRRFESPVVLYSV